MRQILSVSILVLMTATGLWASDEYDPRKTFDSVIHGEAIESAAMQMKKDQLIEAIPGYFMTQINAHWNLIQGLAKKAGHDLNGHALPEIKLVLTTPCKQSSKSNYEIVHAGKKIFATQPVALIGHEDDFIKKLKTHLRTLSRAQLQAFLASIHNDMFVTDILSTAFREAPARVWQESDELMFLGGTEKRVLYGGVVHDHYYDLWQQYFPKLNNLLSPSNKLDEPLILTGICLKGYDEPIPDPKGVMQNIFASIYASYSYVSGGHKQMLKSPLYYLVNPFLKLYRFSVSPDFKAVLDPDYETRVVDLVTGFRLFKFYLRSLCGSSKEVKTYELVKATPRGRYFNLNAPYHKTVDPRELEIKKKEDERQLALQAKFEFLMNEKRNLEVQLAESRRINGTMQDLISGLNRQILVYDKEGLREKIAEAQREKTQLRQQLGVKNAVCERLEGELRGKDILLNEQKVRLGETRKELKSLEKEVEELRVGVKAQPQVQQKQPKELLKKLRAKEAAVKEEQQKLDKAEACLEELKQQRADLLAQLTEKAGLAEKLLADNVIMSQQIAELSRRLRWYEEQALALISIEQTQADVVQIPVDGQIVYVTTSQMVEYTRRHLWDVRKVLLLPKTGTEQDQYSNQLQPAKEHGK